MTKYGTSHFASRRAAESYYSEYGYDNVAVAVQRKIDDGEIHIGKPAVAKGQVAVLIDECRRYAVVEF